MEPPHDLDGHVWFAGDALCIDAPRRPIVWAVPGGMLALAVMSATLAPPVAVGLLLAAVPLGIWATRPTPYRIAGGLLSGPGFAAVRPAGPVRLTGEAGGRMHLHLGEVLLLAVNAADGQGGVMPGSVTWLGRAVADRLELPIEELRDVAEMERFATDPAHREGVRLRSLLDRSFRVYTHLHQSAPREPMGEVTASGAVYWVDDTPLTLDLRSVGEIPLAEIDDVGVLIVEHEASLVVRVGAVRHTLLATGLDAVPELLFLRAAIDDARGKLRDDGSPSDVPAGLAPLISQSERG